MDDQMSLGGAGVHLLLPSTPPLVGQKEIATRPEINRHVAPAAKWSLTGSSSTDPECAFSGVASSIIDNLRNTSIIRTPHSCTSSRSRSAFGQLSLRVQS